MRPLILLLVIIAALVVGLLTFDFGGKSENSSATGPTSPSGASGQGSVQVQEEPLEAISDPRSRTEVEAAPPSQVSGDAPPTVAGGISNLVYGQVVNEANQALANVTVTLTRAGRTSLFAAESEKDRERDLATKTDARGEYRFSDVEPWSSYALVFNHPDYRLTEEGSVQIGATGDYPQPVVVLRPGISLEGWVRDSAGVPIRGANVAIGQFLLGSPDDKDPNTLRAATDDQGHYMFGHVDRSVYMMTVQAEGFGTVVLQNLRIMSEEPHQQDIVMEVAAMIAGRVLSVTGEPIPGAKIGAYAFNQPQGKQSRSQTKTNEKGDFLIEDVVAGTYSLQVMADGYDTKREQRIETGTMDLVLEMVPLPTISGRVVAAANGAPVTSFTIQLRQVVPNSQPPISIPDPETKTSFDSSSGEYTIACPRPGPYEVQATAKGFCSSFSQQISVSKGQNLTNIDVFMNQGGSLRGRVMDSLGQPVAGATVTTRDHEWTDDLFTQALGDQMPTVATVRAVKSKDDGTFVITHLTPADYLLDVQHPNFSREFKGTFHVNEAQEAQAGDVVLMSGGTVTGVVYSPDGSTLSGAVVEMVMQTDPMGTPRNYQTKSGSKGEYMIRGVYPGTYQIWAVRSADAGLDPFAIGTDSKETREKVSVQNGESVTRNFHLGMSAAGK